MRVTLGVVALSLGMSKCEAIEWVLYPGSTTWDSTGRFCVAVDQKGDLQFEERRGPVIVRFFKTATPAPTWLCGRTIPREVFTFRDTRATRETNFVVSPFQEERLTQLGQTEFDEPPRNVLVGPGGQVVIFCFSDPGADDAAVVMCRNDGSRTSTIPLKTLFTEIEIDRLPCIQKDKFYWLDHPMLVNDGKSLVLFCVTKEGGPFGTEQGLPPDDCAIVIGTQTSKVVREGTAASLQRCLRGGDSRSKMWCLRHCLENDMRDMLPRVRALLNDQDPVVRKMAKLTETSLTADKENPSEAFFPP